MTNLPKMYLTLSTVLFSFVLVSNLAFAGVKYYESGLGRDWNYWDLSDRPKTRQTESEAISNFLKDNFSQLNTEGEWRENKRTSDGTHSHRHFQYFVGGRRVNGVGLSIHFNLQGWVEYAESGLDEDIFLAPEPDSPDVREALKKIILAKMRPKMGREFSSVQWEPILWRGESRTQWVSAYQVALFFENPKAERNIIVEQSSGEILAEIKKYRSAFPQQPVRLDTSVKVFKNSNIISVNQNGDEIHDVVTITTNDNTALESSYIKVYREQLSAGTYTHRKIPPADYTGDATKYKKGPDDYKSECVGDETTTSNCFNQAFDGVNAYYHINRYRTSLNSYFQALGNTTTFPDPIAVIVNSLSITDGDTDNAFYYVATSCGSGFGRCLVFLPPSGTCKASLNCRIKGCPDNSVINNLAREGFVVVHEYQHYITDIISGMEFGSGQATVADAIHEGYSDYGAATHLTELNKPTSVTLGLVALPACTGARRDVSILRVMGQSSDDSDPHFSGLSWASGLWKLRVTYDATVVDQIALKSLYFLRASPGFVSAIESLVKADQALYAGVHVDKIRQIFYNEVQFLGSAAESPFKDVSTLEANVGFKGCSGVYLSEFEASSSASGMACLLWGFITLFLGRFLRRGASA